MNHHPRRTLFRAVLLLLFVDFSRGLLVPSYASFQTKLTKQRLALCLRSSAADNVDHQQQEHKPIRLNKAFKATHSRRQADALIASGRVTVNNMDVDEKGIMVTPFVDEIRLDGQVVCGWESLNAIPQQPANSNEDTMPPSSQELFEYVKYWKPRGVTCTTDQRIEGNIIDEIARDGYKPKHRVYPVGRLDKDTSGLILLTNDGRLPNASLRQNKRREKVYNVLVDRPLRPEDIDHLRNGVVITTVAQRDRTTKPLTAPTLPCKVVQKAPCGVQMMLLEGRNRQIRKMMAALNYEVVQLHRVAFGGIRLKPLKGAGSWARLDKDEMEIIESMLLATLKEDS